METITTESPYTPEEEKIREELLSKVEALGLENYQITDKEQYEEIYERSPDYRKVFPTYSDLLEKAYAEQLRNPLEGAILIHGFESNLKDSVKREIGISTDTDVLRKIIRQGAIVSPSKRELSSEEKTRYGEIHVDLNRVCFEARTGRKTDGGGGGSYINSAFFALPVSGLKETRISHDIAFAQNSIASFNEEGISIPLEEGVIFLDLFTLRDLLPDIKTRANILNIDLAEYLNRHFRILPNEQLSSETLWKIVTASIEPSKDVKYHPTIIPKLQEKIDNLGIMEALITEKKAEEGDLGQSRLLENTLLGSPYLRASHDSQFRYYLSELTRFTSIIKQDPEALRQLPYLDDIASYSFLADMYELTEKDSKYAYKLRKLVEIYRNFQISEQERLKKIRGNRPDVINRSENNGRKHYSIAPRHRHPDDWEI